MASLGSCLVLAGRTRLVRVVASRTSTFCTPPRRPRASRPAQRLVELFRGSRRGFVASSLSQAGSHGHDGLATTVEGRRLNGSQGPGTSCAGMCGGLQCRHAVKARLVPSGEREAHGKRAATWRAYDNLDPRIRRKILRISKKKKTARISAVLLSRPGFGGCPTDDLDCNRRFRRTLLLYCEQPAGGTSEEPLTDTVYDRAFGCRSFCASTAAAIREIRAITSRYFLPLEPSQGQSWARCVWWVAVPPTTLLPP